MAPTSCLILHTDQQRYDSLGCNGNPHARTPNLDAVAREGVVFSRHYAANCACMPSRASLLTGLYPPGHNLWVNGVALPRKEYLEGRVPEPFLREVRTMADVFAAAGYDTAAFGKLHLTPTLSDASFGYAESRELWREGRFDEWHGPYYGFRHVELTVGHGDVVGGHYGLWLRREHPGVLRAAEKAREHARRPVPAVKDLYASPVPADVHHTMWLADRFLSYLDRRVSRRPFCAFVGLADPHHPFTPPAEVLAQFDGCEVLPPGDPAGEAMRASPWYRRLRESGRLCPVRGLTDEERAQILRHTYAQVHLIDRAVGRIADGLEARGLWDETVVVFTSDHGDFLCDHGLIRKHEVACDSLLHVPLLLRVPGAGLPSRVDVPTSNTDVLPTVAALCGVPCPGVHGNDMFAPARGGEERRAYAYNYQAEPWLANYTVYEGECRLTWYPRLGHVELFGHGTDPAETTNLAGRPERRDLVAHLMDILGRKALSVTDPMHARVSAY